MQREILVIANEKLFSTIKRESKIYDAWNDFESIILKDYEYMVRSEAEEDFNYKQPIPYAVVVNEKNEIFVYKRGWSGSNAGESRLHSKIAIWIWGHIEREDEDSGNLLVDSLKREIEEELYIKESAYKRKFSCMIHQPRWWVSFWGSLWYWLYCPRILLWVSTPRWRTRKLRIYELPRAHTHDWKLRLWCGMMDENARSRNKKIHIISLLFFK